MSDWDNLLLQNFLTGPHHSDLLLHLLLLLLALLTHHSSSGRRTHTVRHMLLLRHLLLLLLLRRLRSHLLLRGHGRTLVRVTCAQNNVSETLYRRV